MDILIHVMRQLRSMDIDYILGIIAKILSILAIAPKASETIGKAWSWFTRCLEILHAYEPPSVVRINVSDTVRVGLSGSCSAHPRVTLSSPLGQCDGLSALAVRLER